MMKPTNLALPPELQTALSTIATNGQDQEATTQPSLTQSALDWQKSRLRQPIPAQVIGCRFKRAGRNARPPNYPFTNCALVRAVALPLVSVKFAIHFNSHNTQK